MENGAEERQKVSFLPSALWFQAKLPPLGALKIFSFQLICGYRKKELELKNLDMAYIHTYT